MKIRPLGDRVLVKQTEADGKSRGGILLPDVAKKKPQKGEVLAVGPGATIKDGRTIAMYVKPGDVVLFQNFAGNQVEYDGETYNIMPQDDILAILEH